MAIESWSLCVRSPDHEGKNIRLSIDKEQIECKQVAKMDTFKLFTVVTWVVEF